MDRRVRKIGLDFKHWMRENYRFIHRMSSQTTIFPHPQYFCDLDPRLKDRWGQPALRITHDWTEHDANSVSLFGRYKAHIAREMGSTDYWMDFPRPAYHLSTHDVGVHRMGENPATSVTDAYGEVHGCAGLYAVGGGSFVSYGGYAPTETIQALAYLCADHLLEDYAASMAQQGRNDSV
jgi:gluconate 2-dehydrogenase alpha chain